MKSKIMSLVAASAIFFASCGTTYQSTSDNAAYNVVVPEGIRGDFYASYPDATNISWNRYDAATVPIDWELTGWNALDDNDYTVTFLLGGDTYYAWYDSDGNLVGSAYAVSDYSKLPYAVNSLLQNNYKTYTLETVQREMWGSKTAYELKLKGQDDSKLKLLVGVDGTVLKEKSKD